MDTPVCDFVQRYAASGPLRLHMPGHKGLSQLGPEALDITEIEGADVLYAAGGILRASEENAAALFGAARTVYSAEGSSLCIRAMLFLAMAYAASRGRRPLIAAGRNAHKTLITAAALLDLPVHWLYPRQRSALLSCQITAGQLEEYLAGCVLPPTAVWITSPDYLGHTADLQGLAAVCHRHDVLLLVDNAHGAYLHFLPQPAHPMDLGADLCCDSAHKTLPVLTGGAYLHIAPGAPDFFAERAEAAMALFASTSPSYLILQSLDAANRYLSAGYHERLAASAGALAAQKQRLRERGFRLAGDEPLKLTLLTKPYGYTGTALAAELARQGIVCEFADPDHLTCMFTPETGRAGLARLEAALCAVPQKAAIPERPPEPPRPKAVLSPHQALFAPAERLPAQECLGRVLAAAEVSCPPAVPPAVCGEQIDAAVLQNFAYYGVQTCSVVKP